LTSGVQAEAVYALGKAHHLRAGLLANWRQTGNQSSDLVMVGAVPMTLTGRISVQQSEAGLYLQDEWNAASGLTLNYGLRFDHVSRRGQCSQG
jgi:outer membrane receptor protein involved in Fe transport